MYRFALQKKSRQITCPSCGKKKFTPFIDVITGVPLDPDTCGRCSRENHCQYFLSPRELFEQRPELRPDDEDIKGIEEIITRDKMSVIEDIKLVKTFKPRPNNLTNFFYKLFNKERVDETLEKYLIGYDDSEMIIFWQVDEEGEARTGKKMLYHENGKRDKFQMTLMHQDLYEKDEDEFMLKECFFGQHLTSESPDKTIKIVESEKSAVICSIVYPEFIWIATGGKHKWLEDEWHIFNDRDVIIVPDEDAIEDWENMREEMEMIGISAELDSICKGEDPTSDIADLIISEYLEK